MKTSLFLIAVVSAQIASAQYNADGSPRINRQLRGLEDETTVLSNNSSTLYGVAGGGFSASPPDKTNSPTDSLPSSKSGKSSEKGAKSEKV